MKICTPYVSLLLELFPTFLFFHFTAVNGHVFIPSCFIYNFKIIPTATTLPASPSIDALKAKSCSAGGMCM